MVGYKLKFPLLVVLSGFLSLTTAQSDPEITFLTQEQVKDIGDTLQIQCHIKHLSHHNILSWTKRDIENDRDILIYNDTRTSYYGNSYSNNTLQIKDLQATDAGEYTCHVLVSLNKEITKSAKVHVLYPPTIVPNLSFQYGIVATEGKSVELYCEATGYPKPNITWSREGNVMLSTGQRTYSGNVLKIEKVRKEDQGDYFCVAENKVGNEDRRRANLIVEFPPVIHVNQSGLGQTLNYSVDLQCQIEAFPPPAIVWFKDGVALRNNESYSISHVATDDNSVDIISTLRVKNIEEHHYGDYICKAYNKLGVAEGKVNLFETTYPMPSPAVVVAETETTATEANEDLSDFSDSLQILKNMTNSGDLQLTNN